MALCRTDKIPLIHDILCDKKRTECSHDHVKHGQTSTSSKEKNNLLANMGGVEALGKGFTKYAIKKYNQSQLGAISAAAKGYGEGGFTLVKGPPGTSTLCECEVNQFAIILRVQIISHVVICSMEYSF